MKIYLYKNYKILNKHSSCQLLNPDLLNIQTAVKISSGNAASRLNQRLRFALQAAGLAVCMACQNKAKGDNMTSKWVTAVFFGAAMTIARW